VATKGGKKKNDNAPKAPATPAAPSDPNTGLSDEFDAANLASGGVSSEPVDGLFQQPDQTGGEQVHSPGDSGGDNVDEQSQQFDQAGGDNVVFEEVVKTVANDILQSSLPTVTQNPRVAFIDELGRERCSGTVKRRRCRRGPGNTRGFVTPIAEIFNSKTCDGCTEKMAGHEDSMAFLGYTVEQARALLQETKKDWSIAPAFDPGLSRNPVSIVARYGKAIAAKRKEMKARAVLPPNVDEATVRTRIAEQEQREKQAALDKAEQKAKRGRDSLTERFGNALKKFKGPGKQNSG